MRGPPPRQQLKRYAEALSMWQAKFDTFEIAHHLSLDEPTVLRWIHSYREIIRATAAQ